MDVKAEESALNNDGVPDIEKIRPMIYAPEHVHITALEAALARHFL
ncbi:hypothetical protein [Candidatus Kuenenia stuttgartiensis]|nr:hypothetical protein [Candidatus Kuenenia stuttgartiensis]